MIRKFCILGVVMLMAWQFIIAQVYQITMVSADGGETTVAISNVQDIVFENGAMTVNMKSGDNKVTGIKSVKFSELSGIDNKENQSDIIIFPNPVKKYLTVSGIEKNVKINLLDMNGKLLQTVISQENSIEIDVSSLQKGIYLLQVKTRVIKFIKN